jgi:hypothetical protein
MTMTTRMKMTEEDDDEEDEEPAVIREPDE